MKRTTLARFSRPQLLNDPFFRGFAPFLREDAFRPFGGESDEQLSPDGWVPAVDIRETDEAFEFAAELPGLSKEDVTITVEDKVLTLTGARTWNEEEKDNNYRRIERSYGTFTRSFTLPNAVDPEKVAANFKDGVLTVAVPKAEEVKPRQIKIN